MEEEYKGELESFENISESHDSQLIPQQQVYMQENIDDILRQQPIFFEQEIQSGNFNLLMLHMPEDLNELDGSGYSIMHHAISYGRIDVVKFLLSRGANPNVKSSLQQNCLMMASNFGIKELIQIFIDLGNSLDEVDSRQYSALLYAIKSKQQLIALYLISLGAKTDVKDDQGCTIMHWAAYNNDVYMLKYFEGNENYNAIDSQGKTPFVRAISNYSNDAVKYLLQRYPHLLPNQTVDLKAVSIKKIVEEARLCYRLKNINFKIIIYIFLGIFFTIESFLQTNNFIRTKMDDSQGYNLQLISLIFNLYTLFYTIIFFWKTTNKQNQGRKISENLGHPKISYTCNHSHNGGQHHMLVDDQKLDEQIEDYEQNKEEQISELLRAVKLNFEKDEQFQTFDVLMTCPVCKIVRNEQIFHCDQCNACVKGFQFHSIYLDKCINSSNHFFYLLLLLSYQIHLSLLIYSTYYTLHNKEQNILMIFFQPFFSNITNIELFGYYILFICLYVSFINLILQIFCIFSNLTQHEMLYKNQYKYLYEILKVKTFYFMNVKNVGDIFENIKTYIWNQYNDLRLL